MPEALPSALRWTMAAASGVAVANLYYNQPMLADIAREFHAGPHEAGLIATATQVGYAARMPLFIPLGDFVNRRTLVVALFAAVALALAGAALSPSLPWIIAASFVIGITTVIAQILIPLATELAPAAEQGRTIGSILTGVLLGILLARTVSGVVAEHFGWRVMFWLACVGATGAAVAGISGRLSDRRSPRFVIAIALGVVLMSWVVFRVFGFHLWALVVGVILLDAGVQGAQVANQSRVLALRAEARNRVNTIYMISYFSGGSLGSAL